MRIFYTVIFVLTFSSSVFAYDNETKEPIHSYMMLETEESYANRKGLSKRSQFSIWCIDGYRYLFTANGVTQMKENYKGKYRHMECPIKP